MLRVVMLGCDDMVTIATLQPDEMMALVKDACERNWALELHCFNTAGDVSIAKTRFMYQEGDLLFLDKPQRIGRSANIATGQQLEAYVSIEGHIYTFDSSIIRTHCQIKLNQYMTVEGVCIAWPKKIEAGQRRHDLRVFLAGLDNPIRVFLHEPDTVVDGAAELNATVYEGTAVNMSTGGCGVIVNTPLTSKFKIGHSEFISLDIPQHPQPIIFLAEVRSIQSVHEGTATRLGLRYEAWPNRIYLQQNLRPIERFLADRQRALLANKRKP